MNDGKIISGGTHNEHDLYIEPTILDHVSIQDHVMTEEIFGPILPIVSYENHNYSYDKDNFSYEIYSFSYEKL